MRASRKLGALVADLKDVRVRVSGFADSRGDDALNLSLSQERAEMVARELEKAGVPKERLVVEAMGERFASTESTADDQAFERCVEIRFESGDFARQQLTDRDGRVRAARSTGRAACERRHAHTPGMPTCRMIRIIDFSAPAATESPDSRRRPADLPAIRGSTIANYFTDATQQFFAGRWSSPPGKWRIRYSESEFCCLTAGRVVLENLAGDRWEFGPGAGFVVPAGFEGPGK